MQAIILAGGSGSRLGNLVKNTPKPFLLVNKKPFVLKIVERLTNQGVKKIIFCLGHKPKKIVDFFSDGSKWGVEISYVIEDKLMGTAGAVRGAYKNISQSNVIISNGDSFCYFDIPNLVKQHQLNRADITISVLETSNPNRYGLVSFNKKMKISKFIEKNKNYEDKNYFINAGVYVIKKSLIKKINENKPESLEKDFFPSFLDKNMQAFVIKNKKFIDIGTPESLEKADFFFNK